MGVLQHKYTREYFTGIKSDGTQAGYGADGYSSFLKGEVREHDFAILRRIDFHDKRVLEFGFGRGEAIKFALDNGAIHYEGVDFAPAAHQLAINFLQKFGLPVPSLHQKDAIEFINDFAISETNKFDIVLMLDFVEHVERNELAEILSKLKKLLHSRSIVVVNTPAFRVDNDVIAQGVDLRNHHNATDQSDFIQETAGMHCNKYTILSLNCFMADCGFSCLSEAHFYCMTVPNDADYVSTKSFYSLWSEALKDGYPLKEYESDVIEYAYVRDFIPKIHIVPVGRMKGLALWLTDEYSENFKFGYHDEEMFQSIENLLNKPKVIFDVGGYIGVSSLLFSRLLGTDGQVFCFEPNPWNVIRIQKNISNNIEESKKITIYPYALGNECVRSAFILSDSIDNGHSSTSRLSESHIDYSVQQLEDFGFYHSYVNMIKLDDFVNLTGVIPDVIKIDVEGSEHLLLDGAINTLQKYSPHILIELHSPYCALKCTSILKSIGYSLSVLHEEEDNRIIAECWKKHDISIISGEVEQCVSISRYEEVIKDTVRCNKELQHQINIGVDKENELLEVQSALIQAQSMLRETQIEHAAKIDQLQFELNESRRILQHPFIRIQKKLWTFIKRISS